MELIARWQISAGETSEWLPPLLYAAAILVSAWVLSDAPRRAFPSPAVAAWTLATLVSAPVVFPLYLIARIFTRRPDATTPPQTTDVLNSSADTADDDSSAHASISAPLQTSASGSDGEGEHAHAAPSAGVSAPARRRLALPLIYALVLLSACAIYFYRDYHSFDAHLARAANARLLNRRDAAIREYRAALRLSGDAHTHKLLAVQLAEDNQPEAALAEFRAAERGGDPDELLSLRIARALDASGRTAEAHAEYQKFLREDLCARPQPDVRCAEASARAAQVRSGL